MLKTKRKEGLKRLRMEKFIGYKIYSMNMTKADDINKKQLHDLLMNEEDTVTAKEALDEAKKRWQK